MKPVIIIAIASVLLIPLGSSNTSYAEIDVETIGLELKGWEKIEFDNSDVLILTISLTNNGTYEARITTDYVYFVDSQKRTFAPEDYVSLQGKDLQITEEDCPYVFGPRINPGLSAEEYFCYEVPKGIGDSCLEAGRQARGWMGRTARGSLQRSDVRAGRDSDT